MIELTCQHCGTLLRMDDSFAGRDGWCRECKQMVIIPSGNQVIRVEDLPPGEAIGRLQHLLSYAARKADQYKQYLAEKAAEDEARARLAANLVEEQRRSAALSAELDRIKAIPLEPSPLLDDIDLEGPLEAEKAREEAAALITTLESDLALARENRAALEAELEKQSAEIKALKEALEGARGAEVAATSQVLSLEEELACARQMLEEASRNLDSAREEARVCTDALKALRNEYEGMEAARLDAVNHLREVDLDRDLHREEVERLQEMLHTLEAERDDLGRRVAAAEGLVDEYTGAARLNEEKSLKLEADLSAQQALIAELTAERDALKAAADEDRRGLAQADGELEAARELLASLETEREKLRAEGAADRERVAQLAVELGRLGDRLREAEEERDALKLRVDTLIESASERQSREIPSETGDAGGEALRSLETNHGPGASELDAGAVARILDTFTGAGSNGTGGAAVTESGQAKSESPAGRELVPVQENGGDDEALEGANGADRSRASFVERWHREAEKEGATKAQYRLGVRYEQGLGVERNEAEAIRWLTRAAEDGHAGAQHHLGQMHAEGRGVLQDFGMALRWYRMAALHGNARAECEIGKMYLQGIGVAQDEGEALQWFGQAAEKEDALGYYLLGQLHATENGAHMDLARARRCFERAAKRGHAAAQYEMGKLLRNGIQLPQDDRRAAEWFTLAAEQGHREAQLALGGCYETGRGVIQNFAQAYAWYSLAATTLDIARTARDQFAAALTPDQVLEGQVLAAELAHRVEKSMLMKAEV
ncbi:MAG: SEL1-like repeat protein [Candidatus Hydrogenedentes bacterium]|nr:SEL1-like repeat protein [Candidatus Hydrogenedentota bacterium]